MLIDFRLQFSKERENRQKEREADPDNMKIYRFCKVQVDQFDKPYYYYLVDDLQLQVGDLVEVPFEKENALKKAKVMSVGECYGCAFPCHVSVIKTVSNKIE